MKHMIELNVSSLNTRHEYARWDDQIKTIHVINSY